MNLTDESCNMAKTAARFENGDVGRVVGKTIKEACEERASLAQDAYSRPSTTARQLVGLRSLRRDSMTFTAGNASQLADDLRNVNSGSIPNGHACLMAGMRMIGHILQQGRRRSAKSDEGSICVGGGQGAADLVEVF